MLSRVGWAKRVAVLSVVAVFVVGCARADKEVSIAPLVPAAGRVDLGLGEGTRALSSGPGYKGSPSWSPTGDRIAFTVDGYVVDRPTDSEDILMILGAASPSGTEETPSSLYMARADEDPLELEKVENEVSAIAPGKGGLIFALSRGASESRLALTRGSGDVRRLYSKSIKGRVASLSLSPDGDEAVLAVRPPGDLETSVLHVFDLRKGKGREITRLDGNQEILGTPQWMGQYLYFVAGEKNTTADRDGSEPLYEIYRVPEEGSAPEPAPGVGEDFVAASIRVSPDGERL